MSIGNEYIYFIQVSIIINFLHWIYFALHFKSPFKDTCTKKEDTSGTVIELIYLVLEVFFFTDKYVSVSVRYGRNSTICVFSYHDTIKLYASKKTNEVWKYGFFYSYSFIVLLMYHNSKNSPVCGLCHGISFTCEYSTIFDKYELYITVPVWNCWVKQIKSSTVE